MNKPRMNRLIKALKSQAGRNMFNMNKWITIPDGCQSPIEAFKSKGDCGTTACIAGTAAIIDPEFFIIGEYDDFEGIEIYARESGFVGEAAFAEWLDISLSSANQLTLPHEELWEVQAPDDVNFAIKLLTAYRDGGMKKARQFAKQASR